MQRIAKLTFQIELFLLFYAFDDGNQSSSWRSALEPWASSTVTSALRFSTRFVNASLLTLARHDEGVLEFSPLII
jgi:hypothetical protein